MVEYSVEELRNELKEAAGKIDMEKATDSIIELGRRLKKR